MKRDDLVQTWFDDGRGGGYCFGIVIAAGPKTLTVRWESGIRNRVRRDGIDVQPVPDRLLDEARKALAIDDNPNNDGTETEAQREARIEGRRPAL